MALPLRNSRIKLSQGQIFWHELGQGTALVFLHGPWNNSSQWLPVFEHLSADYHCFALDLLGFGESERPKIHYSIEVEVECLAEYLEAMRLKQVCLVGHSLGGWIAASYALKYPHQVTSLVLLAPEGVSAEGLAGRWFWARWLKGRLPLWVGLLRSLHPFAKLLGLQAKIERSLAFRRQLVQSRTACRLLFDRRQAEIKAELLQEHLSWLKVPTLVLQGTQDTPDTLILSQLYAKLAPQAKLCLLQAGEDLPQTATEEVAQQIRDFISQVK